MSMVKCGRCKKTYNNDEIFFDGEVRCPFCHSKSVYTAPKENVMLKQYRQEQEAKKYNDYKYTCPMCSSHNIKNISKLEKAFSFGLFSFASDKL
ncbi:MAG: hypothetical protein PUB07_02485, partial [Clostridia bacterium]|nr:hypothetical protein [Clostridia bacterium]